MILEFVFLLPKLCPTLEGAISPQRFSFLLFSFICSKLGKTGENKLSKNKRL